MYKLQREVTLKERLSRFKSSEKFILNSFSSRKRREVRMRSHEMMTMTALMSADRCHLLTGSFKEHERQLC